jgi:hypothetical protein
MWCFIFYTAPYTNFATTAHEHIHASSANCDIHASSANCDIHASSANRDIHASSAYTHSHTSSPDESALSAYSVGTWQIWKTSMAGSCCRAIQVDEWGYFIGRVCHWGV